MKSKAVFFTKENGAVVREIDVFDPKPNEVQVKSLANGICMWEVWQYKTGNFDENEVKGHEGIGVITKVGKDVSGFKEGDLVNAYQWSEYSNLAQGWFIKLKCSMNDTLNHIVEPAACSINAFSQANLYPGDRVIVFGAGYMGLLLIQLLARYPLQKLVVVDLKATNLALAKQFGADEVIDISKQEGYLRLAEFDKKPFDIVFEASGARDALDWSTRLAAAGGTLGIYAWHHEEQINTIDWHMKGLKVLNMSPQIVMHERKFRSFEAASKLMQSGRISQKKLITHKYGLEDINKGMKESVLRPEGFIKSIIVF